MRWTFRICFMLFLAWAIFMVSPFVALYDLAKAVETRDVARIENRINFRAVRTSVSRQIIGDYLHTPEGRDKLGGIDGRAAANAGAVAVNPMVEQLITTQALIDLLDDGWPQQVAEPTGTRAIPISLEFDFVREAWRLFLASESAGFRSVTIPIRRTPPRTISFVSPCVSAGRRGD